jgi:hypothetical protein
MMKGIRIYIDLKRLKLSKNAAAYSIGGGKQFIFVNSHNNRLIRVVL